MNIRTFLSKLVEAETKSCIENAYSHIVYEIFDIVLDSEKYSLVDVSSWKRNKDKSLLPKDIIAVPDFVITKKDYNFEDTETDIYGCIEVKFNDSNVDVPERLKDEIDKRGYLSIYNNVIYTNGWKWACYSNSNEADWKCDFRKYGTNKEYGKLLNNLCSIFCETNINR